MLGAIRHKGYIPWDDDADIGFLRAEYEKFREACKTELNHEKYYMQDLRDTVGYRWGYGKLRRKGTEFVRMNQEFMPYEQGIFIDLMPFDNVPDGWMSKRVHFFRCFLYRKLFWSEVGSRAEKNPGKRLVYKIIRRIPMNMIIRRYQRFIDRCQRKKTQSVRILTFPTPKGVYGYERRWYTHLSKYPFGDMILPGAQDYDGYLRETAHVGRRTGGHIHGNRPHQRTITELSRIDAAGIRCTVRRCRRRLIHGILESITL